MSWRSASVMPFIRLGHGVRLHGIENPVGHFFDLIRGVEHDAKIGAIFCTSSVGFAE